MSSLRQEETRELWTQAQQACCGDKSCAGWLVFRKVKTAVAGDTWGGSHTHALLLEDLAVDHGACIAASENGFVQERQGCLSCGRSLIRRQTSPWCAGGRRCRSQGSQGPRVSCQQCGRTKCGGGKRCKPTAAQQMATAPLPATSRHLLRAALEAALGTCSDAGRLPMRSEMLEMLLTHARPRLQDDVVIPRSLFYTGLAGAFPGRTQSPSLLHLDTAPAAAGSGKTTEIARVALMLLDEYNDQGHNVNDRGADFRQPFPLQIAGSTGVAAANLGACTLHGLLGWRPLPPDLKGAAFPERRSLSGVPCGIP